MKIIRHTPNLIDNLLDHEIFVFGSNIEGFHGGGAARIAHEKFGAEWGKGIGLYGNSYAIPTMHGGVDEIRPYVEEFIKFARNNSHLTFLVTKIGCGIAGFKESEIAPLFTNAIEEKNIILPESFYTFIMSNIQNSTVYLQNQLQIGLWEEMSGFDENFLKKKIAVIGIGGSGSHMAVTLTRMGFQEIVLVDRDIVQNHNLTRQVLYGKNDVGKHKTIAAKENLEIYHSFCSKYEVFQMDVNTNIDKLEMIIEQSDFVFNLVDDDVALYNISKYCRKHKKASIYFGTGIAAGMTSSIMYQHSEKGPCIACLHGLSTDYKILEKKNKSKKHGITPSWYPTPAFGASYSAVLMVKSLLNKKFDHNYIIATLFNLMVEKMNMKSIDDCQICYL